MKKIFLTGCAGFIGFHLAKRLLDENYEVLGFDAITSYYEKALKLDRLALLENRKNFSFEKGDLKNFNNLSTLINSFRPSVVIHLAAQAGVRYSIKNPYSYFSSNLHGLFNLLEAVKKGNVDHFMFASTSSVYGSNPIKPFRETQKTDQQVSFYAATKKSGELMAHSYSNLHNLPTTSFRLFTVYGPWGRPDMALFKFVKSMLNGTPIQIFNNGMMKRDFTFIDDVVEALIRLIPLSPKLKGDEPIGVSKLSSNSAPYRVVNIGSGSPQKLLFFVGALEKALNIKAKKEFLEMQQGDMRETSANIDFLHELTGFVPKTDLEYGISEFVKWYQSYYSAN